MLKRKLTNAVYDIVFLCITVLLSINSHAQEPYRSYSCNAYPLPADTIPSIPFPSFIIDTANINWNLIIIGDYNSSYDDNNYIVMDCNNCVHVNINFTGDTLSLIRMLSNGYKDFYDKYFLLLKVCDQIYETFHLPENLKYRYLIKPLLDYDDRINRMNR